MRHAKLYLTGAATALVPMCLLLTTLLTLPKGAAFFAGVQLVVAVYQSTGESEFTHPQLHSLAV